MNSYIENIYKNWERQEIRNPNTATERDITEFETRYGVTLMPLLREYFFELNGTRNGYVGMDDQDLIGFWHLDQIRPMKEECPHYATTEEPDLFVFADYSIWAYAWAIRIASDTETAVFWIGSRLVQTARTFEDFLKGYAAGDKTVLYGPMHTP